MDSQEEGGLMDNQEEGGLMDSQEEGGLIIMYQITLLLNTAYVVLSNSDMGMACWFNHVRMNV